MPYRPLPDLGGHILVLGGTRAFRSVRHEVVAAYLSEVVAAYALTHELVFVSVPRLCGRSAVD